MSELDKLREEAKALMKESPDNLAMRSCWNCNGAHEHLKKAEYVIVCAMGCGHYYYKGQDITEGQVMHTSNTDHDETLKEQIQKILTLPHIKKFYDFCIEEDIDEEVMYKIAGWLGSEIYFMPASAEILLMQLIKQDREKAVMSDKTSITLDEDRFDKLSTMQLEALADYHYNSLTKIQDLLKAPAEEKESNENSN